MLCEFRARLVGGSSEHLLLDTLLAACKERGLLKARGRQRTDSTHVLGSLRVLNRLERVAETLRSALEAIAATAPGWLRERGEPEWYERYGRRIEEYRLPGGKDAREEYARMVDTDGSRLLSGLHAGGAPPTLRRLPAIEILRRTWLQQYVVVGDELRLRPPKDMPTPSDQIESPHEPEARYGAKRGSSWVGYKAHLTETCEDDLPHLLTHVRTTIATAADVEQLAAIHDGLAGAGLLPRSHLVDAGYVRARNLVESGEGHGVDLVGPIYEDRQWQAKAKNGFGVAPFRVDWDERVVTCPRGHSSARWCDTETARGPMVDVAFAPADCTPCPDRPLCTRAASQPRCLTLQPRAEHEALQVARRRQGTDEFAAEYARRAGVEGTVSQGVRAFGLRRARYRGLAKTHLQHVATAAAVNVGRLSDWLADAPRAATRSSRFAALAPVA